MTDYKNLLSYSDKMEVKRAIIRKHFPYAFKGYFVNAIVRIKHNGDFAEYQHRYCMSMEHIMALMEEDEEFRDELEEAWKRYEAERAEIVERWRAKNLKKVIADELKWIEAGE